MRQPPCSWQQNALLQACRPWGFLLLQCARTDWLLLLQSTGLADNTEAISATLVANGFNYSGKDFITSGITGASRPACAPPACTAPAYSPPACSRVRKVWEPSAARRP